MTDNSPTIGRKRTFRELDTKKPTEPETHDDQKTTSTLRTPAQQQEFSPQMLKIYYKKLFPYEDLFNWLSYFNDPESKDPKVSRKVFRNREFSFTLKDDIYLRFKSYKSLPAFRQDLIRYNPFKIDIGAIYNIEPNRRSSISSDKFIPEEKELVFDVDISDYDDVRTCCQNADICTKCWPLMACCIKCLNSALRTDFGFQYLFWVFSGRRGIHCWVGDQKPRKFDVIGRSAILDYLKLYSGNAHNQIKVDLNIDKVNCIHQSLQRAYDICIHYFVTCSLAQQHLLDTEKGIMYLCGMVRDAQLRQTIQKVLFEYLDSEDYPYKWKLIHQAFEEMIRNKKVSTNPRTKRAFVANRMEIVFAFVYPRLDVEVSRHMNHLLKSPFVVHPKTGKLCTIIDPQTCDSFDPLNQLTLGTLIDEYNEAGQLLKQQQQQQTDSGGAVTPKRKITWQDTSLRHVIQAFRSTFLDNLRSHCALKRKFA